METVSKVQTIKFIWEICGGLWAFVFIWVFVVGVVFGDKKDGNFWRRFKSAIPAVFILTGMLLWCGGLFSLGALTMDSSPNHTQDGGYAGFGLFFGVFILPFVVYGLLSPFYSLLDRFIHFDTD